MPPKPQPLPRDTSRFKKFAPEPRARLCANPTKGFEVLTSIEMLYPEHARQRADGPAK